MSKAGASLVAATLIVAGCGFEEGRANKAGQAVGETVTDFAAGVGKGVDKRMEVAVELSEAVTDLGLRKTVSKSVGLDGSQKGITVYLLSERPVSAKLIAKALNAEDLEIGRAIVETEFGEDDAKYVTFHFDAEMDRQMVRRYAIDVRPTSAERAQPQESARVDAEKKPD